MKAEHRSILDRGRGLERRALVLMSINVSQPHFGYLGERMPPFKLELQKLPSSDETLTIYKATGKLSLETVNEFIQKVRPETAANVVLDMSGVTFLDSAGVGSLVSLFVSRRNRGQTFGLAALTAQGAAVVTVAGLQNLLPVYKTVEEATAKKA
jgi:anti-sigma B factor antagonist